MKFVEVFVMRYSALMCLLVVLFPPGVQDQRLLEQMILCAVAAFTWVIGDFKVKEQP